MRPLVEISSSLELAPVQEMGRPGCCSDRSSIHAVERVGNTPIFQNMVQPSSRALFGLPWSIDVDALACPGIDHPTLVEQSIQLNEASCFLELRHHCVR